MVKDVRNEAMIASIVIHGHSNKVVEYKIPISSSDISSISDSTVSQAKGTIYSSPEIIHRLMLDSFLSRDST